MFYGEKWNTWWIYPHFEAFSKLGIRSFSKAMILLLLSLGTLSRDLGLHSDRALLVRNPTITLKHGHSLAPFCFWERQAIQTLGGLQVLSQRLWQWPSHCQIPLEPDLYPMETKHFLREWWIGFISVREFILVNGMVLPTVYRSESENNIRKQKLQNRVATIWVNMRFRRKAWIEKNPQTGDIN